MTPYFLLLARNAANNLRKALPLRPRGVLPISGTSRREAPPAAAATAFAASVTAFSDALSSASRLSTTSLRCVIAPPPTATEPSSSYDAPISDTLRQRDNMPTMSLTVDEMAHVAR